MTVSVSSPVAIRPFQGYADPGLPAGWWFYANSLVGDASGGLQVMTVLFQTAGSPAPSFYYSLEQFNYLSVSVTTRDLQILSNNMDPVPQLGAGINLSPAWSFTIRSNAAFNVASEVQDDPSPLFLGHPVDNNLDAGLIVTDGNGGVTQVNIMHAQGYYWSPGSINTEGGPRKPPSSVYGSGRR